MPVNIFGSAKKSFFFALLICNFCYSKDAGVSFSEFEHSILKSGISTHDDWVFSHSKANFRKNTSTSKNIASNRASYTAKIQILDSLIEKRIDWKSVSLPPSLQPKFVQLVRSNALQVALDFSGIQQVHSAFHDSYASVVLALPKGKYILDVNFTLERLINSLLEEAFSPNYKHDLEMILELEDGKKDANEILEYLSGYFSHKYKIKIAQKLSYSCEVNQIPDGFLAKDLLSNPKFTNLPWKEKLDYFPYFFCHPQFFHIIANDLGKNGLNATAQSIYFWGSRLINYENFSAKCYDSIKQKRYKIYANENGNFATLSSLKNLPKKFDFKEYGKILNSLGLLRLPNSDNQNKDYLHALDQFHEEPPNVEGALESLKKSLESDITANACNYLGRCLVLLSKPELAQVFFMQASQIDEKHPYAMANLAICYDSLGKKEAALSTARSAMEGGHLDDWAVGELQAKIFEPLEEKKIDD